MDNEYGNGQQAVQQNLKIMCLNVCGLVSKLQNEIFIEECKRNDILCFCETKTDDTEVDMIKERFCTMGFETYIKNRQKLTMHKSGGMIMAVKSSIQSIQMMYQTQAKQSSGSESNKS